MITREQIKYCFTQATQAERFSQEYCIDRLMELFENCQCITALAKPTPEVKKL